MWLTLACASDLTTPPDADGDGWHAGDDCDDADDAVHPDAAEVCGNGVDDDCDLAAPGCGLFGEVEGEDPLQGPSEGDGDVGSALAMVGDEIATGAPDAAIVYDARTMVPWIVGSTASFGTALVGGDFDGDGVADLAVGARPAAEDAPEVWLFLAPGDALVEADADLVDDARDARDDVTLTGQIGRAHV